MINKRKVRLMTKTAIYERTYGSNDAAKAKYYKADYVAVHMWNTAIAVTIAFLIVLFLIGACNFERIIYSITKINYTALGAILAVSYAALQAFFLIMTYLVYSYRYTSAELRTKTYQMRLHKIFVMGKADKKENGGV